MSLPPNSFLVVSLSVSLFKAKIGLFLSAVLLSFGGALPSHSQELVSEDPIEFDLERRELIARGRAVLSYEGGFLTANEIIYNQQQGLAIARERAAITYEEMRLVADELTFHEPTRTGSGENIRFGRFPLFLHSASFEGDLESMVFSRPTLYLYEPRPLSLNLRARRIIYYSDDRVRAEGVLFRAGPVPFFYLPSIEYTPERSPLELSVGGGSDNQLGTWASLGIRAPLTTGVRAGGDIALYSRRGFLFGPAADYETDAGLHRMTGRASSGFISDQRDPGEDILGREINRDRYFLEWEHKQFFGEQVEVTGMLNAWSDSFVMRDFRKSRYEQWQEPDTFIEAAVLGENHILSAFSRFRPNDFHIVQERLPEVRLDAMPTGIGGGLYHKYHASAAVLRERPVPSGESLKSERLDAYYGLSRPILTTGWMSVTPVAGGRATHYNRAEAGRNNYTRVLGEIGFDVDLTANAVYDYTNEIWNIDGIRHVVEPRFQYRFIPGADRGRRFIPQVDDQVFTTNLEPLGLDRIRNIDELDEINTLRLSLDNYFQTRDAEYGSRNLLSVLLANDVRFSRQAGENVFSNIHTELAFTPVYWLRFDMINRFDPEDFTLREWNTGLTVTDADVWSVTLATDYLRSELQQYFLRYSLRLNEAWGFRSRFRYDARGNRFTRQVYSMVHTLRNTWEVEYSIDFHTGAERESSVGFGVSVALLRF
ncbi:MAG: LPS assembly protein LptD [Opitutales bacterium]